MILTGNLTEPQIKLINIFESRYQKLVNPDHEGRMIVTTAQVFTMLQQIWPSNTYETFDVLVVMEHLKIETINGIHWMLQPV